MSDVRSEGRSWSYRFSRPDGSEVETRQLSGDEAAETCGRQLSSSNAVPIVIHRHSGHVDDWEYVTEVDERT